jgi:hypothetical protein
MRVAPMLGPKVVGPPLLVKKAKCSQCCAAGRGIGAGFGGDLPGRPQPHPVCHIYGRAAGVLLSALGRGLFKRWRANTVPSTYTL